MIKRILALILIALLGAHPMTATAADQPAGLDSENTLYLDLPA